MKHSSKIVLDDAIRSNVSSNGTLLNNSSAVIVGSLPGGDFICDAPGEERRFFRFKHFRGNASERKSQGRGRILYRFVF
jgi:hypothetical protein